MSLHSSKWEESIWKYIENQYLNSKHLPGLEHWYQTHYINYISHHYLHREVKIEVVISYLLSSIYKQFNVTRENIYTDTFPFLSPSEMHLYSHLYITYFRKLSICNISKDLDRKLQAIASKVRTGLSFMSIKTVNLFIVKQNVWEIKF